MFTVKEFDKGGQGGSASYDLVNGKKEHVCQGCHQLAGEDEFDGNITQCDACFFWGCFECNENSIPMPHRVDGTACRGCVATD